MGIVYTPPLQVKGKILLRRLQGFFGPDYKERLGL
jgi:hypothetical protein